MNGGGEEGRAGQAGARAGWAAENLWGICSIFKAAAVVGGASKEVTFWDDASSAKQTATEGAGKVANQVTHRMRNGERGRAAEVEWDLGSPPLLSESRKERERERGGKVGNGVLRRGKEMRNSL